MYRKDQLKGIIALILFACLGITYYFFQDSDLTLTVSILAIAAWFLSMYFLNRKTD